MQIWIVIIVVAVIISSCKKKEDSIGTSYIGNWKILDTSCNGTNIVVTGMNEYISLGESSGNVVDYGSGCYASHNNFSISVGTNDVTFSNGLKSCSPANCSIPYTLSVSGGSSQNSSYTCTSGAVSSSTLPYTVDSNGYLTASDGTCTVRYARVSDIPPNANCINVDSGSMSAPVTGATAMFTDGISETAMQFRVSSDKKLRGVKVLMESWSLTTAKIQLYKGGTNPEQGELVATITKTYGLHQSSYIEHIFDVESPILLKANFDYYFVFSGSGPTAGTTIFAIKTNSSNLIQNGQIWSKTGTTWTADVTKDMNIGFIFDADVCN